MTSTTASRVVPRAEDRAAALSGRVARSMVRPEPMQAEVSKRSGTACRHLDFWTANRLHVIGDSAGMDCHRALEGLPLAEVVVRSDAPVPCAPHADHRDPDRRGRLTVDVRSFWPDDAP